MPDPDDSPPRAPGRSGEVLRVFLRLGLSSFGGPLAHVGYFRDEFVRRRAWLDDAAFAQLLSICQVLPGPTSSQLGFAIGLQRAGWRGALAAFFGFTLPSALAMFALALSAPRWLGHPLGDAVLHALKLLALVVVAHGVYAMARALVPDLRRAALAAAACGWVWMVEGGWSQPLAIALGAALGAWWCVPPAPAPDRAMPVRYRPGVAWLCALLYAVGLAAALLMLRATATDAAAPATLAAAFYRAGALVFGGGHVVLPLLERELVATGWIGADTFLAGYGAAQAMPGPMFSLAAYLGADAGVGIAPGWASALALLAMFAPGMLILLAALPAWRALARRPRFASAMAGVNAAVVGLLVAVLYDPLWREGVRSAGDVAIVVVGLALTGLLRRPALWAASWCVLATLGLRYLGGPAS